MDHGHRGHVVVGLAVLLWALIPSITTAGDAATPSNPQGDLVAAVIAAPGVTPMIETKAVAIVESRSVNPQYITDLQWRVVATAMGHTATIVEQTALDALANLDAEDILIVSSGVIDLPANRVQTIADFAMSGRPVYLQGEYGCDFPVNVAFGVIVGNLGGTYSPSGSVSGALEPMTVLGELATNPNSVPTFDGFYFGCAGSGDSSLLPFLQYNGQDFGFIFTPPVPAYGPIIYTTDQDWVREADFRPTSIALMQNILTYLGAHGSVAVESLTWSDVKSLYR